MRSFIRDIRRVGLEFIDAGVWTYGTGDKAFFCLGSFTFAMY
jgi:hypothetical protein